MAKAVEQRNIQDARVPQPAKKNPKDLTREEVAKIVAELRERDSEMVTGIFKNLETPGGGLFFNFALYPGDEFVTYTFHDNERYRIPRGVARHLNNNCFYREYKHLKNEFGDQGIRAGFNDGRMKAETMQQSRKVHRFSFSSLEFTDEDTDMQPTPNLYEVSVSP